VKQNWVIENTLGLEWVIFADRDQLFKRMMNPQPYGFRQALSRLLVFMMPNNGWVIENHRPHSTLNLAVRYKLLKGMLEHLPYGVRPAPPSFQN